MLAGTPLKLSLLGLALVALLSSWPASAKLQLGVTERDGRAKGTGGLEATIRESDGLGSGILNDYFGHALATYVTNWNWSPTRYAGYGPVPGFPAPQLSLNLPVAEAFGWRGYRFDPSGLIWMGARYYDPVSGRFLSPDPLGHEGSLDLYSYANSDPINNVHPEGRCGQSSVPPAGYALNGEWAGGSLGYGGHGDALGLGYRATLTPGSIPAGMVMPPWGARDFGDFDFSNSQGARMARQEALTAWANFVGLGMPNSISIVSSAWNYDLQGNVHTSREKAAEWVSLGATAGPLAWQAGRAGVRFASGLVGFLERGGVQASEWLGTSGGRSAAETTVFRVEGLPNTRLIIGDAGQVSVLGNDSRMLWLNFGQEARAQEWLVMKEAMPGVQLKSFEVPQSFLNDLRSSAVPESMARQFPGRPLVGDVTKAPDQFGLRPEQIEALRQAIIQGSGKVH